MGIPNVKEGGFTLVQTTTLWDLGALFHEVEAESLGFLNSVSEKSEEDQFVSRESDGGEVLDKPE